APAEHRGARDQLDILPREPHPQRETGIVGRGPGGEVMLVHPCRIRRRAARWGTRSGGGPRPALNLSTSGVPRGVLAAPSSMTCGGPRSCPSPATASPAQTPTSREALYRELWAPPVGVPSAARPPAPGVTR